MKKQLSLIALTGASIVLVSASAQANTTTTTTVVPTPVPATVSILDPIAAPAANAGFHSTQKATSVSGEQNGEAWKSGLDGQNAKVFTAEGTIEKYIKFKSVDSNLELGDIGSPTFVGDVFSASAALNGADPANATATAPAQSLATRKANSGDGLATVTFDANTYVQVQAQGQNSLLNTGADGLATTDPAANKGDDYRLVVGYALAARGKYSTTGLGATPAQNTGQAHSAFTSTSTTATPALTAIQAAEKFSNFSNFVDAAGTGGAEGVSGGTATDTSNLVVTFEPNGGVSGNGISATSGSNGFQLAARVKRNGLNDYHGKYTGTVKLSYWQW